MSIKKEVVKSAKTKKDATPAVSQTKVTFTIAKKVAEEKGAEQILLLGDFNNWDKKAGTVFTKASANSKVYKAELTLETGREYQFRYLYIKADGTEIWENEPEADKQVLNEFGDSQNSVIVL